MTISIDSFINELQKIAAQKCRSGSTPIRAANLASKSSYDGQNKMVTKLANMFSPQNMLLNGLPGALMGAGTGALAGGEDHRLLGAGVGALGGGLGGILGGQLGGKLEPMGGDILGSQFGGMAGGAGLGGLAALLSKIRGGGGGMEGGAPGPTFLPPPEENPAVAAAGAPPEGEEKKEGEKKEESKSPEKLAGIADMAGRAMATLGKPGVLKNMALVGGGGAAALAGDQAIKDWQLGRQLRQSQMPR